MTGCRWFRHICSKLFLVAAAIGFCGLWPAPGYGQVSVVTYHNDNARTGQNLNETILTPANVNQNTFGQVFSANVDGYVVAQPLYLQNVSIPGLGAHNVVYVATLHDSVYAFDADTGALLWQVSFINPALGITSVPISDAGCPGVTKFTEHGVVGTGVIDPNSGTLYLVAKTKENGTYFQRLHALDVGSGQEKFGGPVVIAASFPGTGDGGATVNFDPLREMSRAAVLQIGNTILLSFAANGCKLVHNHGWMLAYEAGTLQQTGVFNTTPNGNNGGIWHGGSGPAVDSDGNIYVETADAVFDANVAGPDFGDSILNLNLGANGLFLADSFTPLSQASLNASDRDLGSVGPLILPDQPGPFPHLLVGSGKDATIYLVNRDNMGGYNPLQDQIVQELASPFTGSNRTRFQVPTYWNGMVYLVQIQSPVAAYSLSDGLLSALPVSQTLVAYQRGYAGSISANGITNGILWLVTFVNPATTLHAFDATNLAHEFYNSDQAGTRDVLGATPDFVIPTIANGRVYLGTQTQFVGYGLLGVAPVASLSPSSVDFGNQTVSTTSAPQLVTLTNTGTSNLSVNTVSASGDFAQTNTCNSNIAVGASCTISITFTPTTTGARSGAITITDNAADSPQSVSLSGTGVQATAPAVSLSPGSLDFANQTVGTMSPIQSSTLTNTGTAMLSVTSITASGDFALATTGSSCPYSGGTVDAGVSCTIDVTFTPTTTGARSGAITVTDNAADSPQSVNLSGTGVQPTSPAVSLSPGSLNFASQTVGTTSPIQSSTLTNTGTAMLSVTSITASGDFALATTGSSCSYFGGTVDAGASCTIDVTFTPTQAGNRTGSVVVADNAADSPQSLNLGGTGTQRTNPVAFINQPLVPAVAIPGGADFTLTVNGAGFVPASVVNWNGSPRTTTYLSDTQLTAAIGAADIASTGTAVVTVTNPTAGGAASNAVFFGVTNSTPGLTFVRSDLPLGANALAEGDFNNDGKPDLAAADPAGSVSVLLSSGDGTFQVAGTFATGRDPDAVAVGDFNGDGKLDLAVANSTDNNVSVLLGNGDGTFQPALNYGTGNAPSSLAVGDFNGDGNLDLAVVNRNDNNVSVLLGNGDGTLQTAVSYAVGGAPSSTIVADFNGDGVLDLATANPASNSVSVLLGNPDGTFQAAVNYGAGGNPTSLATGDFNGDGRPDLVVTNWGSNNLSVLSGNGDGTFQTALTYGAGANPSSVVLGDLNGDGKLDLAVANSGDNTVATLVGNGDGTFQAAVPSSVGNSPGSALIGDFDGDGRFDLVVVNTADATFSVLLQAPVLSLSAPGLNFGSQNVGTTSNAQTATVTNTGSATLYISNRTITGSNPGDFSENDNCGSFVLAGASCTASVTFTPAAAGPRSAALSFTDNASGSPHNLDLLGTGTVPGVGLSPSSLTFPAQLLGTLSKPQPVIMTNTGTGTLNISSITITGANPADFSQLNTCGASLAAGDSCTISVAFQPTKVGKRVAALNIADDAPGSPQSVGLAGISVSPAIVPRN